MDGNGFYYTLSTISQTLAGAFGFLVAVVLYRMQSIKDSLPMLEKKASEAHTGAIMLSSSSDRAQERAKKEKELTSQTLNIARGKLVEIRAQLKRSVNFTAATIGVCLMALPWGKHLTTGTLYYGTCIGVLLVVGIALYCVVTYVSLVLNLTE